MTFHWTYCGGLDGDYISYEVKDALGWFEVSRWMIPGSQIEAH